MLADWTGQTVAYKNYISPSGVGYDIACGNMAVMTNLLAEDISYSEWHLMAQEIERRVSFGIGRKNNEPVDSPVFERIINSPVKEQRALFDLAVSQLGTVGSGNHYVDVLVDQIGRVWIGVHFGSRGFGHKTAMGFMNIAQGRAFHDGKGEGEMDAPPLLLDIHTPAGQDYIEAMSIAGEYAYAGREAVVNKVLKIMGGFAQWTVHNHHNFAWREMHFGEWYWVVRKGATPAFLDQYGFVGGSMGDCSVILKGTNTPEAAEALHSTVHGAGRVMSRTQAAGKQKWLSDPVTGKKRPQRVGKGLVDFDVEKAKLEGQGVILRGAGADEAPPVYRKLQDVLAAHAGTIQIEQVLMPKIVVMAGGNEYDPYKD
jgi:tRNA-splicing ligase RtcB